MERPLRVTMLGLRGFPDVQGGVEKHAENLARELVRLGCEVEVLARAPYVRHVQGRHVGQVRLVRLWSPRMRSLEAITHSILGALVAGVRRPDVLHIHAIGPALAAPLARALGLRVVVTHHGPDYAREKWGRFAARLLELGERFGMTLSHAQIAISRGIADLVRHKYGAEAAVIPNGVDRPAAPPGPDLVRAFGLSPGRYVISVGRIVPEKRHLDLIEAFAQAGLRDWDLALVGGADHHDSYAERVEEVARATPGVQMLGVQRGEALQALYAHAGVFVLPSSHEGLPIALLEAASHALPVLASDIPANLEVELPADHYFPLGDVAALAGGLKRIASRPPSADERAKLQETVLTRYDWSRIASETITVYRAAISRRRA